MSARKASAGDGPYPLPEGWRWVKLGEVLTQHTETEKITDTTCETFMTVKLYGGGAVRRKIKSGTTPRPFTGYRVRAGQFVYSRIDARNGAFAMVPEELDGSVVSKDFPVFALDRCQVDEKYWVHFTKNPSLAAQIKETLAFGATNRQRVKEQSFVTLLLPLPPLPEQRRIADVLDMANGVIAVSRRREELFRGLRLSVFREMFPEDDVSHIPLSNICEFGSGSTPSKKESRYWNGSTPWFSAKDLKSMDLYDSQDHISQEALDESSIKLRPAGSVAMVVRGMILDHTFPVSVLRVDSTTNQDLKVIEPTEGVNIDFLASALKSRSGWILDRALTSAHGTKRLEMNLLKSIPIPDVSLEKQEMFADRVNWLRQVSEYSRCLDLSLSDLLSALQSRAFRGEL